MSGESCVCRGSSAHTDQPCQDIVPGSPILAKPWPFPKEKELLRQQERAPVLDIWNMHQGQLSAEKEPKTLLGHILKSPPQEKG